MVRGVGLRGLVLRGLGFREAGPDTTPLPAFSCR